jgi:hypothetical protein
MDYSLDFLGNDIVIPVDYRQSIAKGDFIKTPDGRIVIFNEQDDTGLYNIERVISDNNDKLRYSNYELMNPRGTFTKASDNEVLQYKVDKINMLQSELDDHIKSLRGLTVQADAFHTLKKGGPLSKEQEQQIKLTNDSYTKAITSTEEAHKKLQEAVREHGIDPKQGILEKEQKEAKEAPLEERNEDYKSL